MIICRSSFLQKKKGQAEDGGAKPTGGNTRAFAMQSTGKARRMAARRAEKEQRRLHAPMMERTPDEPPPFVVVVQGPPGVGKSTIIRSLIKHYTRQGVNETMGPITVIAGKARRLTFVEAPQDLHGMMDCAKFADLVLTVVDGSFGFEMETFEFLNLLQVHGFPKVMGVLTHLDKFKDATKLKKIKKQLKHRFWTEIYQGAKLFYFSGIRHGKYPKREVLNLARFISIQKFRPLAWRLEHPYLLADRMEDVTPRELVRTSPKCDREITLYGYLRGANLRPGTRVHVAGVGDFDLAEVSALPDPCPRPETIKKRGLNERERLIYGPMADVGGLMYDKDAVYIDIPDWKVQFSGKSGEGVTEGEGMVLDLQRMDRTVDEKLRTAEIRLFAGGQTIRGDEELAEDGGSGSDSEEDQEELGSGSEEELVSDEEDEGDDTDEWSSEEEGEKGPGFRSRDLPAEKRIEKNGRVRCSCNPTRVP